MIPYGRQTIDDDDVAAVVKVLRSDYLTQGPAIESFEQRLAEYCGAQYAVVVNSGTAALHAAYVVADLNAGDEFITSSMTFVATANAGVWQGARPVFVDIDPLTGNMDAAQLEAKITERTKAIVPVDYTGRPANLSAIQTVAKKYNLPVIEDACQALGASYQDKKIGAVSDLTTFSFHPVKTITTGEGGAIVTNNEQYYRAMKKFITHGVSKQDFVHPSPGSWYFEMQLLGMNYRLTDFQAALGMHQLTKVDAFVHKRAELAERYHQLLNDVDGVIVPEPDTEGAQSSWHLYVVRVAETLVPKRNAVIEQLRNAGIGVGLHHIPVHLHPFYEQMGFKRGDFPETEKWYDSCLTLPLFPRLTFAEQDEVVRQLKNALG